MGHAAGCKAPNELVRFSAALPQLKQAVASEHIVRIAALGSSSTEGAGASSSKMCYPARLEAELNRRHGIGRTFAVENLGVGGELASDMLARIDSDVIDIKPHLVIWQTGVNDAIQGISIDDFKTTLVQGISAIRASGADVVLLGMQYYPKSVRVPLYKQYLTTMREVASELGVPLLNRYAIMKYMIDSAHFSPAELLAPDQFHQNDFSYGCMSTLMADAIEDSLVSHAHRRADADDGKGVLARLKTAQNSDQSLRMSAAR